MNLEGQAAGLAFVIAGISFGTWGAVTTMQLRALNRRMGELEELVVILVERTFEIVPELAESFDGSDRHPRRVLADRIARLRSLRRAVS